MAIPNPNKLLTEVNTEIRETKAQVKDLPFSPVVIATQALLTIMEMQMIVIGSMDRQITALEKRCYRLENPDLARTKPEV